MLYAFVLCGFVDSVDTRRYDRIGSQLHARRICSPPMLLGLSSPAPPPSPPPKVQ